MSALISSWTLSEFVLTQEVEIWLQSHHSQEVRSVHEGHRMGKAKVSLLHMIHWQLKHGMIFTICFTNSYV